MPPAPQPADPLASKETAAAAGAVYRIRLPASDSASKAGSRALVATVRFLDGEGNEIGGNYPGCFTSDRFGQYIYLPTQAGTGAATWSEQRITAPGPAAAVRVNVYPWRTSSELRIEGELEVSAMSDALFEHEMEIKGGLSYLLHLALADTIHSDRAAVVQILYLDADGVEVPGPYPGCNQSERFGQFTYAATPKPGAESVRLQLQAPDGATRARFLGHRWKGTPALRVADEIRLELTVPPEVAVVEDWLPVQQEGKHLPVALAGGLASRPVLLRGQYVGRNANAGAPALRVVCEYLDVDDRPIPERGEDEQGVIAQPLHLLGATEEIRPFTCFSYCPPGAAKARLRVYPGQGATGAAIHRTLAMTPLQPLENASRLDARMGVEGRTDLRYSAFSEWRLRVVFECMRTVEPDNRDIELCIFFGDRRGHTLEYAGTEYKLHAGTLRRAAKSLYLKPDTGASGDPGVEHLRGVIQVLPPPGAESVVVRLGNHGQSEILYACTVEPFDALAESRLVPASISSAMRMEGDSRDAAELVTNRLLQAHPDDLMVLGGALDVYRRIGDATRMEAVANHVMAHPKPGGKLKFKARHILASLLEQDPHWSIRVPGTWQGQQRVRAPDSPLRVAHLFKTSLPYENTGGAIRCLNIVKFQKKIGMEPMVVTPLGYPGMNLSGAPWEREDVEGVPHFRLNSVQRDDLRTIPSTRQLEYTALLTANLLREQGVDVVQASSGYRGYEQALVGQAVARKLGVPFVYEVRSYHEHTWRPMAEWVLESEFTRRRMAQEDRCMREADAVVTICETMKEGLVARGIPEEKVFVVPNSVDLDKFQPIDPDPQLREQIGLREGLVAGYISNISAREGHHVLLRAVAQVRASGVDLQCLIVGSGPELENLKGLAADLGIARHVVFTGDVPHEDISRYYALIDVFVVPRVADFASDFVTPMKPFEAMALGLPVLISDRPALREVVEPSVRGAEFKAGCVASLAHELVELAESAEKRNAFALAGRQWVEEHRSWRTTIARYLKVYAHAQRHADNS